jgi:fructose-1-phosphate kinase PfkB-like protein
LYGIALGAGLDADVTLVTGCQPPDVVEADLYRRLVGDLRVNGKLVIADLTGPPLRAALAGGIELLRLNDHELVAEGYSADNSDREIVAAAQRLRAPALTTSSCRVGQPQQYWSAKTSHVASTWLVLFSNRSIGAVAATRCSRRPGLGWHAAWA